MGGETVRGGGGTPRALCTQGQGSPSRNLAVGRGLGSEFRLSNPGSYCLQ
jgi:hypothetical protein